MSMISEAMSGTQQTAQMQMTETSNRTKKTKVSGKTIGEPQLSEQAAKYYEELKKKYSNMDFILVSADQKEYAKSKAASYANANKMVVLIDEEKIEKMASDENYRKQYEGIIANAASGLSQLGKQLSATGAKVKGYGMQVNDNGTASYFAVVDKSLALQKQRIANKAEAKREERKAEAKKAKREQQEERIQKSRDKNKADKAEESEDIVTITASSISELINKVNNTIYTSMSDYVQTDEEKKIGQQFDYVI